MNVHGIPIPGFSPAGAAGRRSSARGCAHRLSRAVGRSARCALLLWIGMPLLGHWTDSACGAETETPAFTVLFTAEAHGALLPCDCPLQSLGGVARRATAIGRFRERGPVLLVDAGHWAAGGLYDEDSDGDPRRDALRTELMARAMALMKYDAVVPPSGTDTVAGAATFPRPFPDAVFPEALRPSLLRQPLRVPMGNCEVVVEDSSTAGSSRKIESADGESGAEPGRFRVLLSSEGEEGTTAMARNGYDLAINAGRKSSTRSSWAAGQAVVANFDYQAQRLGVAEVFRLPEARKDENRRYWDIRVRFVPLTKEIPDDPQVSALLQPHLETLRKKGKRRLPVEVFIAAECPYWNELAPDLGRIAKELGDRIDMRPHFFVGRTAEGAIRAPRGDRELQESRVQVLVLRYYPERFWDWLAWRAKNRERPWEDGAKELGLIRARLAGALAAGEADSILGQDALLAQRRQVRATPTLIVGNRFYDGETERLQLLRVFCGLLDEPRPDICRTVPACFNDAQCRQRGVVGRCLDAGTAQARCDRSRKAVPVPAVVLVEREALHDRHERILETLLNWLPGLEWRVLDPGEGEGKELAERVCPERYPAVLLDPVAKTEVDFRKNLGDVTDERGGWLTLKPAATGASRIVARTRMPGRADLFLSRFSRMGQEALEVALAPRGPQPEPELRIHDALYWQESLQPDGTVRRDLASRNGLAELQEAAIAAAVRQLAPEKLASYLRERGKRRGSLFWDRALQEAGIDVSAVRLLVEGPGETGFDETIRKTLGAEADLLAELKAAGEVILLAENCEVVPVRSREELAECLERIGGRRGASAATGNAPPDRTKATGGPVPSRSSP